MSNSLVNIKFTPPVVSVIINRPHVMNAYNQKLLDRLKDSLEKIITDKDVKVILLTGEGTRAFSVGADIDWLEGLAPEQAEKVSRIGHEICEMIEQAPKAVIAAVNGYALGGGMEIALACDLRIASTRARFGQPEVSLGMVPGFDGTQRLPKIVGIGRAKEILFTGNIIDAEEAYEIGLVNRLVTPRDLMKESKELAHKITKQSSRAVELIKNAINLGLDHEGQSGSEYETECFANCFDNKDSLKRIKKFKKVIRD